MRIDRHTADRLKVDLALVLADARTANEPAESAIIHERILAKIAYPWITDCLPVPEQGTPTPRAIGARYGHTNLIANEWRAIADFYETVFGCTPVPPERDYRGADLERATAVAGAALRGIHLRLPGGGLNGPTLEIYSYETQPDSMPPLANRPGWGHIAFAVDDVIQARDAVLEAGGHEVGDVVTLQTADARHVTWCYLTDPEGNIIELQSWSAAS